MRLGVVIPVYNHARYVRAAIESVLGQTRPAERIIAINDGSTDDSLTLCRQFQSRGVEILTQENQGAHAAINRGVALAAENCEVIAILNSDDHYARERFAKCLPALENDPAAGLVVSALRYIDDDDNPLPDDHPRAKWLNAVWSRRGNPDLDLAEWMGQANFVVTSSNVIARREFLLAHPFKPYRYNHDYYFFAQAAIRDVLRVVGEPLVNYRVHVSNTINTNPAPLMRELLLQHLELYRDLAPELTGDARLRSNFLRYVRGGWDNVSALHAGILQVLLAQCVQGEARSRLEELVSTLDEAAWPELAAYPNKELVNAFDGSDPFRPGAGALAGRVTTFRAERDDARAKATALRELAHLRHRLLRSRWVALGRAFGCCRHIGTDSGKTPDEKLENLRVAVKRSRWLRLGRFNPE